MTSVSATIPSTSSFDNEKQHHYIPSSPSRDLNNNNDNDSNGNDNDNDNNNSIIPNEFELVLLCLDYLRNLRRGGLFSINKDTGIEHEDYLRKKEYIDPNWLSLAIFSLSKCFLHDNLKSCGSDPYVSGEYYNSNSSNDDSNSSNNSSGKENINNTGINNIKDKNGNDRTNITLPSLNIINKEILLTSSSTSSSTLSSSNTNNNNIFDDNHTSNIHRFFHLNGLASGVSAGGPISLTELYVSGINVIGGRSRYNAEQEMIDSPLFEQFVNAVQAKGFFDVDQNQNNNNNADSNNNHLYEERFRKVISKFRSKLAVKAEAAVDGYWMGSDPTLNDWTRFRIKINNDNDVFDSTNDNNDNNNPSDDNNNSNVPLTSERVLRSLSNKLKEKQQQQASSTTSASHHQTPPSLIKQQHQQHQQQTSRSTPQTKDPHQQHQIDIEEAERFKNTGNTHMQNRDFESAVEAYTTALRICPAGITSHVYFCNRAAALLSLKKYNEAVMDAERSLALKPDYGKAHARLGLAQYVQGEYRLAVDSYTQALKYEPDNKTSKSYLEKAQYRLSALNKKKGIASSSASATAPPSAGSSSSSVVSDIRKKELLSNRHFRSPSPAIFDDTDPINTSHTSPSVKSHATTTTNITPQQQQQSSSPSLISSSTPTSTSNSPNINTTTSTTNTSSTPQQQTEMKQRQLKEKEADKLKNEGNTYMSQKQYSKAVECYTSALRLSPAGINSHVYYSNRAAALCYLEKYIEAERDSEKSLVLKPDYGKAHARLGLSRFFLGDYVGAITAYENALLYDPGNKASESYLNKAKIKLEEMEGSNSSYNNNTTMSSSSGYDNEQQQQQQQPMQQKRSTSVKRRGSGIGSSSSSNMRRN